MILWTDRQIIFDHSFSTNQKKIVYSNYRHVDMFLLIIIIFVVTALFDYFNCWNNKLFFMSDLTDSTHVFIEGYGLCLLWTEILLKYKLKKGKRWHYPFLHVL